MRLSAPAIHTGGGLLASASLASPCVQSDQRAPHTTPRVSATPRAPLRVLLHAGRAFLARCPAGSFHAQ
jgi:hypothetical protein